MSKASLRIKRERVRKCIQRIPSHPGGSRKNIPQSTIDEVEKELETMSAAVKKGLEVDLELVALLVSSWPSLLWPWIATVYSHLADPNAVLPDEGPAQGQLMRQYGMFVVLLSHLTYMHDDLRGLFVKTPRYIYFTLRIWRNEKIYLPHMEN